MARRPFWFIGMSVVFVLIALSFPLQIMFIYGHGVGEMGAVLNKLTVLNWLVMGGLIYCAYLVWRAEPYCRVAVPILILLVGANNAVVADYAIDYSFWTAHMATFAFAMFTLPLLAPRVQYLLMHPEKRWWLRADRRRLTIPVTIEGTRLKAIKTETFDISNTGAFVCASDDLGVGDWVTLRMRLSTLSQIRCQAVVVRRSSSAKGMYPAGVGIQFMHLGWRERRELRRCLEREARV